MFGIIALAVTGVIIGVFIALIVAHVKGLKFNWCFFFHKWTKPVQVDSIYVETKRRCKRCGSIQAKLFSGKYFTINKNGINTNI